MTEFDAEQWIVDNVAGQHDSFSEVWVKTLNGDAVAYVGESLSEQSEKTAVVISAAPEMLNACRLALSEIMAMAEMMGNDYETCLSFGPLTIAINKALGKVEP